MIIVLKALNVHHYGPMAVAHHKMFHQTAMKTIVATLKEKYIIKQIQNQAISDVQQIKIAENMVT